MNEKIKTTMANDKETYFADSVCCLLDAIGWSYERRDNKIQVSFESCDTCESRIITCVADVLHDKIFISSAVGIKAKSESEILKFINYLNTHKILFGRFVLSDDMTIWYDYTADIKPSEMNSDQCYKAFSIAANCCEYYCNNIINVAVCAKTAEEAIKEIK